MRLAIDGGVIYTLAVVFGYHAGTVYVCRGG